MKILFIVQNIIGEGTYLRAFELAKALTEFGHELTIIASSKELRKKTSTSTIEGIEVIQVSDFLPGPTRSGWDLINILSRRRLLKSRTFDIVHGFETRPTVIFPILIMKRKGTAVFLDWADWFGKGGSIEERPNVILRTLFRPIETYFENHFRQVPDGTTVICRTLEKRALSNGVSKEKICLLPNGFDIHDWEPISINKAKTLCDINSSIYTVGYLGSLFPEDALLLGKSINLLMNNIPNVKLLHIGKSNYRVKHLLKDENSLIETGPVDFNLMMTYLSACDILWLPLSDIPANKGRFPLKFSNYLSSARPIISTDVGDIPEIIKKYNTGIVVKDDPDSIVKSTNFLYENDKLSESLAKNAGDLSQKPEQSWRNRAIKLLRFYDDLR